MARLHRVPDDAPRVVGYVRVSTAREEMISPEIQIQAIKKYCERKDYQLDEVIQDLDATGRTFARQGIQRAIAMVESGDVAAVVVWKFSRFGRNRPGWAANLARVEDAGGRLESATEDVDAATSAGRLSRGIFAELAAFESDRIGESWQEAHANRLANGLPHSGHPRFGYTYHRATARIREVIRTCPQGCGFGECTTGYVIDPETAPILREMYHRYNLGDGSRAIAQWLNEAGIKTPNGIPWRQARVMVLLHTGFAAGLLRRHPSSCPCKNDDTCENNNYLPGAHEAIISKEDWSAYCDNFAARRKMAPRAKPPTYPLAGLIHCSKCDAKMHANSAKFKGVWTPGGIYVCHNYTKAHLCKGTWMLRPVLEERVLKWVKGIADKWEVEQRAEQISFKEKKRRIAVDRESLEKEHAAAAEAIDRLTVNLGKGLVSEAAYRRAVAKLEAEQSELEARMVGLDTEKNAIWEPPIREARLLADRWDELAVSRKAQALRALIGSIVVTSVKRGVQDVEINAVWGEAFRV